MSTFPFRSRLLLAVLCPLTLAVWALPAAAKLPNPGELRSWIEQFKTSPRGPFERIRWFCKDGSVLPPKAYACRNHGGGIQHGEWNEHAKALRAGGYTVANVLAGLDPLAFVGSNADLFALQQILLERFLIGADDGWIFRGARTYRGALQIEDEEAGSRAVVNAMLGDATWRSPERFLLLRETVRLLPLQADEGSAAGVRKQALVLAGKDKAFTPLRAKIHNQPDAGDAAKVRAFAKEKGKAHLKGEYERLAAAIDALYASSGGAKLALALAPQVTSTPELSSSLQELGKKLQAEQDPATRVALASRMLGLLRKHFPQIRNPEVATQALQVSIALESDGYVAGSQALTGISSVSAERRQELLDQTAEGIYGAGLITGAQLAEVKKSSRRQGVPVSDWAGQSLASNFGRGVEHLAPLEAKTRGYSADRIQVSLVPIYSGVAKSIGR